MTKAMPFLQKAILLSYDPRRFDRGLFFMGWKMGFEPTVSSATNWRFNQLSYIHHMARQKGLEPLTYCLEGSCSIQLSYWRISLYAAQGNRPFSAGWSG